MKKFILMLIACSMLFAGCSSKEDNVSVDLTSVANELSNIEFDGEKIFSDSNNLNNEKIIGNYDLDLDLIDEYAIYISQNVNKANMYIIVKPKQGNESVVKYQIKDLFKKIYNAYNGYYPEEAKLIEDRLEKEQKGYLIYIVSNDNDAVYKVIDSSF